MGPWRIMLSEILPNLASMITVFVPMMLAYSILLEAYLSFLGAGVQAPNASWGTLISDGLTYIQTTPTFSLIPGAMLVLTVLSINVIDYKDSLNVDSQIAQRFPITVSLVVPAALIWLAGAIVLGSISARRVGGLADRGLMVAAIMGVSIPVFLLAAVLLYAFAFRLSWFPNTGYTPLFSNPAQWAYHLFLPWIS